EAEGLVNTSIECNPEALSRRPHRVPRHPDDVGRSLRDDQLNQPARRIRLLIASVFLNAALTCGHASALHRTCNIARRSRLMRSHGCCHARSASFISVAAEFNPAVPLEGRGTGGGGVMRAERRALTDLNLAG